MSSFAEDKKLDTKMNPYKREIYDSIFPNIKEIKRPNWEQLEEDNSRYDIVIPNVQKINMENWDEILTDDFRKCYLDKELSIDATIVFENGSLITIQEKSRRFEYLQRFGDFTFEYYANRFKLNNGQWFKLISQLFFYGFVNEEENKYVKYYLIDSLRLRIFLLNLEEKNIKNKLKTNPHRASNFYPISFDMPDDCFISSYDESIAEKILSKRYNLENVFG